MQTRTNRLALLAFIGVSIAWGTTYAGMRVAVETIRPLMLAGLRFGIFGAVLLVVLRATGVGWPSRRDIVNAAFVGVLLLTCANSLIAAAEQYLPSVLATLLINLGPLVYVALARMTGERVAPRAWAGFAVGFAGILTILSPHFRVLLAGGEAAYPNLWRGIGMAMLGPFLWSSASLYAARHPPKCNVLMTVAVQNLAGGGLALLAAVPMGQFQSLAPVSGRSWLAFAWLITIGSALGYVSYMYCVRHLPSTRVAVTVYLNTATALVVGALVLGEVITPAMLAGGAILMAGVALVQSARAPHPPPTEENPHEES